MAKPAGERLAPKPCRCCGQPFVPKNGKARVVFCSRRCAALAKWGRRPEEQTTPQKPHRPCANCGRATYLAGRRLCLPCWRDPEVRWRFAKGRTNQPARPRPPRECYHCESVFVPKNGKASRRFCSRACRVQDEHLRRFMQRWKVTRPPGRPLARDLKLCARCGTPFLGCRPSQRVCSWACHRASVAKEKAVVERPTACVECGAPLPEPPSAGRVRKFCSPLCNVRNYRCRQRRAKAELEAGLLTGLLSAPAASRPGSNTAPTNAAGVSG